MAASNIIKHAQSGGSISLVDTTPTTPLTCTVRFDNADFKISGMSKDLREVVTYKTRGKTSSILYADATYPSLSFSCKVADLSELSAGSIFDWIQKTTGSPYAARTSTNTIGNVDCTDVIFTMEGTDFGDSADQIIKAFQVHLEWDFAEGGPNAASFTGTVYGNVSVNGVVVATAPR